VAVAASTGAALIGMLTLLFLYRAASGYDPGELPDGCTQPGGDVLIWYTPLLAWSPLLFLVARDYRHRAACRTSGAEQQA
jgi:hypothetical protein